MTSTRAKRMAGPGENDVAAVAHATSLLLSAVNSSDVRGVMAMWSDDGVLMPPHHPSVHGREGIARYFGRLFEHNRFEFAFTSSRIEICGDVAFERVEYRASAWPAGGGQNIRDQGKGLHVYRRQSDGSWKLALDIWNSDIPRVDADQ